MRKRNNLIQVRLSDDELSKLDIQAQKCGLSRASFLRQLICGIQPKELPPPDFYPMMRQLYYCGNNLNQIAMKAHALNAIDAKRYDEGIQLFRDAVQNILSAVLEPIPIDQLTQGQAEAPVSNDERNDVYRNKIM